MPDAYLVGGVRTPHGKYGGRSPGCAPTTSPRSSSARPCDAPGVPAEAVDEVILGAANQAGEDNRNVARMAALLAGLPDDRAGVHRQPPLRQRPDRCRHRRAGRSGPARPTSSWPAASSR